MKSITQINLARLTVGKSLSKTDSAQLQPAVLITKGGASSHVHYNTHLAPAAKYPQLHQTLPAAQHGAAARSLSAALKWNANCPRSLAITSGRDSKIFLCILSQLKRTPGSSCSDIHFKIRCNYAARGRKTSVSLCESTRRKQKNRQQLGANHFRGRSINIHGDVKWRQIPATLRS